MLTKLNQTYEIKSDTSGQAWKKCANLVDKEGEIIHDGDKELKEVLNVFISVNNPWKTDEILDRYGDENMIRWMEDNFTKTKPIPEWGYSYGQRLFDKNGINQIENIIKKLRNNPESKSATVTLLDPEGDQSHVPCIVSLDFKIRHKRLVTTAFFRSQDAGKKMYADILALHTISKRVAQHLNVKAGPVNIFVVSLHLYSEDREKIKFLLT
jgi:thymidylate synthase (methanogen type)